MRTNSAFNSNWDLSTFSETRYRLNKVRPERAFTEISPSRKLGNKFAVALPVRLTAFDNPSNRSHEVRLGLQGIVKLDFHPSLKLKYRNFIQLDKGLDNSVFENYYWRHKFDLEKVWNAKVSSRIEQELWHDFLKTGKINRYRLILSSSLAAKNASKVYLGFLTQTPIFTGITTLETIGVIRYQLKF